MICGRCEEKTDNENDLGLCDICIVDVETEELGVTNQALLDVQGLKNRVETLESAMQDFCSWLEGNPQGVLDFEGYFYKWFKRLLKK